MNQAQLRTLVRLISKNPKTILPLGLVALLALPIWYSYEVFLKRPSMTFMGVPQVEGSHWSHILRSEGYLLEYSEKLGNPLWVSYKVTQDTQSYGKRPGFSADSRSPFAITTQDYKGSGYDRGHMAPNHVIASRYGREAQLETFLMTNISPQKPNLNQKSWQRLESASANYFSKWYPEFWVITGPIFDDKPKTLKGNRVAIPKAFYKIFIRQENKKTKKTEANNLKTLAFIFPQTAKPNAPLTQFLSDIDAIEQATGIDFFHKLPDAIENKIEAQSDPKAWQFDKVARLKNRY